MRNDRIIASLPLLTSGLLLLAAEDGAGDG
jgi:hypothetical protein